MVLPSRAHSSWVTSHSNQEGLCTNRIKYIGINLIKGEKGLCNKNYKTLLKEITEDTNKRTEMFSLLCGTCWFPICWLILVFKQVFGPSSSHSHLHVNGITLQKPVGENATSELDEGS